MFGYCVSFSLIPPKVLQDQVSEKEFSESIINTFSVNDRNICYALQSRIFKQNVCAIKDSEISF